MSNKLKNRPHALLSLVALSLVTGFSSDAKAWYTEHVCNGSAGPKGSRTIRLDRCTIPAGSTAESDVLYAVKHWNDIPGTRNRFAYSASASKCSLGSTPDWTYDIILQNPGVPGLASITWEPCVWPYLSASDGEPKKGNIKLDPGLSQGNMGESSYDLGLRETALHELGHSLGLAHEDRTMSIMSTAGTAGKYGVCGASSCSGDSEMLHPDDMQFGLKYQSDGTTGVDFGASAWIYDSWIHLGQEEVWLDVWPGNVVDVWNTTSNRGTSDGSVQTDIVMYPWGDPYDRSVMASWTIPIAKGAYATYRDSVTVPWVPPGIYQVALSVDPYNRIAEIYENNNQAFLGLYLVVH